VRVLVAGAGYVGLTAAACLASLGLETVCYDVDRARIAGLRAGLVPFREPGLGEMLRELAPARLGFTADLPAALPATAAVLICVGTPSRADGSADLGPLRRVAAGLARSLRPGQLVITKSTVPPGTNRWLAARFRRAGVPARVVANPEFLREGSAVADFLTPDRIVLGAAAAEDARAADALFSALPGPRLVTSWEGAELVKYGANAFLAVRVSFVNELARLCGSYGADVTEVARGVGLDRRIGTAYLAAGLGYGGPCLPKDLAALQHAAGAVGQELQIAGAAARVNAGQVEYVAGLLERALGGLGGRRVAVLGLSFKGGSDDLRGSPALRLVERLLAAGAQVRAHDPLALPAAAAACAGSSGRLEFCADLWQAAADASAVAVATDAPEYRGLDLQRLKACMAGDVLLDARNALQPADVERAGLVYVGVGRGAGGAGG